MALFHNSGRRSTPRQAMRLPILKLGFGAARQGSPRKRKKNSAGHSIGSSVDASAFSKEIKKMSSEKMGNGCPCRVRMVASKLKNLCAADKFRTHRNSLGLLSRELPLRMVSVPRVGNGQPQQELFKESRWQTYSTRACVPMVVALQESIPNVQGSILVLGQ